MLTEKDYCDYKLVLTLKELGYDYIRRDGLIHLYDAQKWLREEKKILIEVFFSFMNNKQQLRFEWHVIYNLKHYNVCGYNFDALHSKENYNTYEEALSEGIKAAVKLLKGE